MGVLLDGKSVAQKIRSEIASKLELACIAKKNTRLPCLSVVIVGDNDISQTYVRMKRKACQEVGFDSSVESLPEETTQEELLKVITVLNNDDNVDGILVQLPLPKHINTLSILSELSPEKDVDGLSPINFGKLILGLDSFIPCTPNGVMRILKEYEIPISGKRAVIIGRSNIVTKPLSYMLLKQDATVSICHSKTVDLESYTKQADILAVAIGSPHLIQESMVKDGAVVIDIGINRVDGHLLGDSDFKNLLPKVSAITPVPGGVGPMTIAMLISNTWDAWNSKLKNI